MRWNVIKDVGVRGIAGKLMMLFPCTGRKDIKAGGHGPDCKRAAMEPDYKRAATGPDCKAMANAIQLTHRRKCETCGYILKKEVYSSNKRIRDQWTHQPRERMMRMCSHHIS